jgi:MFS family permease
MFKNIKLFQPFNFFIWLIFYTAVEVVYFARITGSYALAVSLFSISQLTKAVLEVPSGIFSDTYGRRQCQIIGAWLSFLAVLLYALASNYWVLVLGSIGFGASQAFFSGNNDALLFESLPKARRQQHYENHLGKIQSTGQFSLMVGGLVGAVISPWSMSLLLWLSLIPQIIGLIISYRFSEPRKHLVKEETEYGSLKTAVKLFKTNLALRRLSLAQIIQFGVGEASWQLVIVFYNLMLPVWLAGMVVTSHFLISAVSYRLSGRVIKRLSALKLLIYQEVYGRIIFVTALLLPTPASPVMMALASVLYGPGEVAKNSLLQEKFTDKQRATMSSLVSLVGSVFYAICGVIFGIMADKFGVTKTLLTVQLLLLPVLWIYLKLRKNSQ